MDNCYPGNSKTSAIYDLKNKCSKKDISEDNGYSDDNRFSATHHLKIRKELVQFLERLTGNEYDRYSVQRAADVIRDYIHLRSVVMTTICSLEDDTISKNLAIQTLKRVLADVSFEYDKI